MKQFKYTKNLILAFTIVGGGAITSCEDANYQTMGVRAYIDEALSSAGTKLTVQASGETTTTLNIHISEVSANDNHYQLVSDQSVLDEYNRINGTGYIMLPEEYYSIPNDIVIKAGEYKAEKVTVAIKPFSEAMASSGESYALPLKLTPKDNSISAMPNTGAYVIATGSIIKFSAPILNGGTPVTADMTPGNIVLDQFTVEIRFQINGFYENQALFNGGGEGSSQVYIRLEDPVGKFNLIQIVGKNTYLNAITPFEKNKWQHLAIAFDGSKYLIYVNGKLDAQKEVAAGAVTFSNIQFASSGSSWFRANCLFSEIRLWGKALNETQIKNNMTVISPKADGLKAYWKMNEGTGKIFKDYTGNGYNATAASETPGKEVNINWIHDILSTDLSTPW